MIKFIAGGITAIVAVIVFTFSFTACEPEVETLVDTTPALEPVEPTEPPVVELSEDDTTDTDVPVVE